MNCTSESIYLYVDGQLHGAERDEVQRHLSHCAHCAKLMRAYQTLLAELDAVLAEKEPPAWLEQAILNRAYGDLTTTFQQQAERRRALRVAVTLGLMAVAFLRFDVVSNYLMELLTGIEAIGSVVWNMAVVFFKGLSFVTLGMAHDLSGQMPVWLLFALTLAAILSLALARTVMKFDAPPETP